MFLFHFFRNKNDLSSKSLIFFGEDIWCFSILASNWMGDSEMFLFSWSGSPWEKTQSSNTGQLFWSDFLFQGFLGGLKIGSLVCQLTKCFFFQQPECIFLTNLKAFNPKWTIRMVTTWVLLGPWNQPAFLRSDYFTDFFNGCYLIGETKFRGRWCCRSVELGVSPGPKKMVDIPSGASHSSIDGWATQLPPKKGDRKR